MNYKEFLKYKEKYLKENPLTINLSENNLYSYFNFNNELKKVKGHVNGNIHRCHLVEDWLNMYNLTQEMKKNIGVSNGVRESLSILASKYKEKKWSIPKDVYPFYQKLFQEKDIHYTEYKTLTNNIFSDINYESECFLLTLPLKPKGVNPKNKELKIIKDWLNKNKENKLFIDCAYLTKEKEMKELFGFFGFEQVYYFFSLSKSFCMPNVFGVTYIPEKYIENREIFKNLILSKENLNLSYQALNMIKNRSNIINQKHQENYNIVSKIVNLPLFEGGYLFYLKNYTHKELLDKNIMSIPATVFGGKEGVVISTLID